MVAPEALPLAEEMGDRIRDSRACWLAVVGIMQFGGMVALRTSEAAPWVEQADRYAQPDTVERARADTVLGVTKILTNRPEEGVAHLGKALELARRLDDPETFWRTASFWFFFVTAPQHGEEALGLAEELAARPRRGAKNRNPQRRASGDVLCLPCLGAARACRRGVA